MTPNFVSIKKFARNPMLYLETMEGKDLVLTKKDKVLFVLISQQRFIDYCSVILDTLTESHKLRFAELRKRKKTDQQTDKDSTPPEDYGQTAV